MYFWQFHLGSALYISEVSVFVRTIFATCLRIGSDPEWHGRVHLQEAAVEKKQWHEDRSNSQTLHGKNMSFCVCCQERAEACICVSHMLWQRTSSGKLTSVGGVCLRGVRWESVFLSVAEPCLPKQVDGSSCASAR